MMEKEQFEVMENAILKEGENGRVFGLFEHIANHGHEIGKDALIQIIKELDYAIGEHVDITTNKEIYHDVIDNLKEAFWLDN